MLNSIADKLVLVPSTAPIEGIRAQRAEIPGLAGILDVWKMKSPGATSKGVDALVVTFVGNAARAEYDAEDVAELWGDRALEVWAVNYPGYGRSAGKATLRAIAPAAVAAFDAAKAHAGDRPVFVSGRSIGTAAALHVAVQRSVAGVILHSPVPLRQVIVGQYGWWNLWLGAMAIASLVPADLDSIDNARRARAPGVILFTGADTMILPAYQQQVVDAYAGEHRVVNLAATDHIDPVPIDAMDDVHAAFDWLTESARARVSS